MHSCEPIKVRPYLTNLRRSFNPDVHPILPFALKTFQMFGIANAIACKAGGPEICIFNAKGEPRRR